MRWHPAGEEPGREQEEKEEEGMGKVVVVEVDEEEEEEEDEDEVASGSHIKTTVTFPDKTPKSPNPL